MSCRDRLRAQEILNVTMIEEERDLRSYLRQGEATDEEIDDFIGSCFMPRGTGLRLGKKTAICKMYFFHDMFIQQFIFSHLKHSKCYISAGGTTPPPLMSKH